MCVLKPSISSYPKRRLMVFNHGQEFEKVNAPSSDGCHTTNKTTAWLAYHVDTSSYRSTLGHIASHFYSLGNSIIVCLMFYNPFSYTPGGISFYSAVYSLVPSGGGGGE